MWYFSLEFWEEISTFLLAGRTPALLGRDYSESDSAWDEACRPPCWWRTWSWGGGRRSSDWGSRSWRRTVAPSPDWGSPGTSGPSPWWPPPAQWSSSGVPRSPHNRPVSQCWLSSGENFSADLSPASGLHSWQSSPCCNYLNSVLDSSFLGWFHHLNFLRLQSPACTFQLQSPALE